jgi:hypothetical protein
VQIVECKGALLVIKLTKLPKISITVFDSTSLKAAIGIIFYFPFFGLFLCVSVISDLLVEQSFFCFPSLFDLVFPAEKEM